MPKSEKDAVVYLVVALACFVGAFAAPLGVAIVLVFAAFLLLVTGSLGYVKHSRGESRQRSTRP